MYRGLSILGFIPARAGSKGIPGKNIRPLAGKPLLLYTIETALASKVFDEILVSTDGAEISRIARQAGVDVPFVRPPELATDNARGIEVLHHAISWLEARERKRDCVMVLQPTSPLRMEEDIIGALGVLLERGADAVVSVCEAEHHPWWSNPLPEDCCMEGFLQAGVPTNRQALPKFYRLNGAVYLARWEFIKERDTWLGPGTYAYVMPRERSVDIDSDLDLILAETLIKTRCRTT